MENDYLFNAILFSAFVSGALANYNGELTDIKEDEDKKESTDNGNFKNYAQKD